MDGARPSTATSRSSWTRQPASPLSRTRARGPGLVAVWRSRTGTSSTGGRSATPAHPERAQKKSWSTTSL